jgi:hypothetical protein
MADDLVIDDDYIDGAEGGSGTHTDPTEDFILRGDAFVDTYWNQKKLTARGKPTDQREPVQFEVSTGNRKRILQIQPPCKRQKHVCMNIAGTYAEVAKIEFNDINELNPKILRSMVQTGIAKIKRETCIKCSHTELGKSGDFCNRCVTYYIHGDHDQEKLQDYKTKTCLLCENDLKLGTTFVAHCCQAPMCLTCFDKYTKGKASPKCPFCCKDAYAFLPRDAVMHPLNSLTPIPSGRR